MNIWINIAVLSVSFLPKAEAKDKQNIKKKPNVILILADDLGCVQVGCYGTDYYQTPNIDELAKNGMRFTNAYAGAAICSPTRASIMTGKYPARLHLTDFIPGNSNSNFPLTQPDWQKFLSLEEITIGEALKENGYATAVIGKWHLSSAKKPPESLKYNPDKQGFDDTFVTYKPSKSKSHGHWQTPENDAHNVDTITSRSIEFIEKNNDKAFFLIISHNTIHDPLMEKSLSISKYEGLEATEEPENNPILAAMVERLDKSVGRVIDKVKQCEIEDNTVIIFYSDNGGRDKHAKQTPFRKGKGWLYEGGIRVPLIFSWKGNIEPNSLSHQMVSSIDMYPTILEMTDSKLSSKIDFDGISISNLLTKGEEIDRQTLYWNYPHYHGGSGMKPASAIRSGDYKLIEWYEPKLLNNQKVYELYNLAEDVGEKNDLSTELPEKFEELKQMLTEWKINVNAQEPTVNIDNQK